MKTNSEKIFSRAKSILVYSISVFLIISTSTTVVVIFYSIVRESPFLEFDRLPKHTSQYLVATTSLVLGGILSLIFRKMIFNPLYKVCSAIDEIAGGNYEVSVKPGGFKSLRILAKKTNEMATELRSVETMRYDFVNNFSHEFKTPIVSIEGFAKLLRDTELPEDEKNEYLNIIISESGRLAELSSNILFITKLENQSILTDINAFNVSEQIRLVIVLINNKWRDKNIDFSFDGDDYEIYANELLLQQLWTNIIDNAFKYSPEGSSVSVAACKEGSNYVFTVCDSGKGMTEEEIRHAFDKFFQGDMSHKATGNGIGLTVAKKICELHGGKIEIKRGTEKGMVFEITLPSDCR